MKDDFQLCIIRDYCCEGLGEGVGGAEIEASFTGDKMQAIVTEKENPSNKPDHSTGLEIVNGGGTLNVVGETNIEATGAEDSVGVEVSSSGIKQVISAGQPEDLYIAPEEIVVGQYVDWNGKMTWAVQLTDGSWYSNENSGNRCKLTLGEETKYEKGETNLTLTGDVTADNIGMEIDIAEPQTANILIDGTVEGGDAGIVLTDQTKIDENLTLTVWQVVQTRKPKN